MTSPVCFPPADSNVFLVLLRMLLQHFSLICHCHVSGRAPSLHSPHPSNPTYSLLKINLWLMMSGQEMIWNLLTLYKGEGGAFI